MKNFSNQIKTQIELLNILKSSQTLLLSINKAIESLVSSFKSNKQVLIFGNGGSASDALHITGELVGRFTMERKPLNIICLNSNQSIITAWGNDYSFDTIFSRQVEAHYVEGSICWGISTSGNSKNVINAFVKAKELGLTTIALTGETGGKIKEFSDILINVPSDITPRIQELHLAIYHFICEEIEHKMFTQ